MHTFRTLIGRELVRLRAWIRNDMLVLSVLAMVVGAGVGGAVIGFREAIDLAQAAFFGTDTPRLAMFAVGLPWWQVLAVPTLGGLVVGVAVRWLMPGRRPEGIADVIEASALRAGRMKATTGLWAAAVSSLSIGCGASVGREGPAVHLGASLGSWVAERLHLTRTLTRTLLGCGVAAAVAASFNAPIAGALFANEVVIGHYGLSAFAPVVIASVLGTFVSRAYFGDFPAFTLIDHPPHSLWEFPAVLGLGIVAGLVAAAFMRSTDVARDVADRVPGPIWLKPAIGGLLVGALAIPFPHVLGIGYGVTEATLDGSIALTLLMLVCAAKVAATAVSLGFGFGGGVFSPSLVIGATLGGAYGILATAAFPEYSAGPAVYAIVGMGAVAASVLGAPISTTLIVFEMTGDYKLTMAVMLAVVVSTAVSRPLHARSFFAGQLERRGLDLHGGYQAMVLRGLRVSDVMSGRCEVVAPDVGLGDLRPMLQHSHLGELFVVGDDGALVGTVTIADLSETAFDVSMDELVNTADVARRRPPVLSVDDTLETALRVVRTSGEAHIAVVEDRESAVFAGCLHERDAMAAYNRALIEARREERE